MLVFFMQHVGIKLQTQFIDVQNLCYAFATQVSHSIYGTVIIVILIYLMSLKF